MKKFFAILAIALISASATFAQTDSLPAAAAQMTLQATSSEPEALWESANAAYNAGEWDKALTNYKIIADKGLESAPLYYNMANAYFKKSELARAFSTITVPCVLLPPMRIYAIIWSMPSSQHEML